MVEYETFLKWLGRNAASLPIITWGPQHTKVATMFASNMMKHYGRRIYLDCDGVLADFNSGFEKLFGQNPRKYEKEYGSEAFWRAVELAPQFYRCLPLKEGARDLVEAVRDYRPIILTGAPRGTWAHAQKIMWVEEHFPDIPVQVTQSRNKSVYCQKGDVLIDDWPQYQLLWEEKGGHFILHTSTEESLRQFEALMS